MRETMEYIRKKKRGVKSQGYNTSVNNAAASTAIGSSKGNLIDGEDEEEFDDAMMIRSALIMSINQISQVSGMEGYNLSDEDEEEEQIDE